MDDEPDASSNESFTASRAITTRTIYFDLVQSHEDVLDARELLHTFDIRCCAAYIDPVSATFHIQDPHLTLKKMSQTEKPYAALMSGFAAGVQATYHDEGVTSPRAIVRCGTGFRMPRPWWLPCAKEAVKSFAKATQRKDVCSDDLSLDDLSTIYALCSSLFVRRHKYTNRNITLLPPVPLTAEINDILWNRRVKPPRT